jgi:phage recombination protein Bet
MTATEIVAANGTQLDHRMTEDQVELVKRQICRPRNRPATDDELALFRYQCERTGLDPFARQIYAIFRWDGQSQAEKMTIQAGIDGLRLIAERTNKYAGQEGPFWCGSDGVWHETWMQDTYPVAAKAIVRKVAGGQLVQTWAVAHWREFVPLKNGKPMGLWPTKGAHMLGKCAEALALRKAFPAETGNLYIAEEMAAVDSADVSPESQAALEAGATEPLDPERAAVIKNGIKALGLTYKDIDNLMGTAGLDSLRARSAKALTERIESLTPEQADAIEAEMEREAEKDA